MGILLSAKLALALVGALTTAPTTANEFDSTLESLSTLDRAVIERTIQQHFDEVATCYQAGLERNDKLAGMVTVRIAINASGAVAAADVQTTTLNDKLVETCICDALKKWKFPKPKGKGLLFATYPFVLKT